MSVGAGWSVRRMRMRVAQGAWRVARGAVPGVAPSESGCCAEEHRHCPSGVPNQADSAPTSKPLPHVKDRVSPSYARSQSSVAVGAWCGVLWCGVVWGW